MRGLSAHRGRLAMTVLAVAMGVAFVAGTMIFIDAMRQSIDAGQVDAMQGRTGSA